MIFERGGPRSVVGLAHGLFRRARPCSSVDGFMNKHRGWAASRHRTGGEGPSVLRACVGGTAAHSVEFVVEQFTGSVADDLLHSKGRSIRWCDHNGRNVSL